MRQTITLALILAVWLMAKVPIVEVPAAEKSEKSERSEKTDKVTFGQQPLDGRLVRTIPIVALASFDTRWQPTSDLPPMVVREPETVEATLTPAPLPKPPPPRAVEAGKRATDVCARHGQRRVEYSRRGYKMWRCQR